MLSSSIARASVALLALAAPAGREEIAFHAAAGTTLVRKLQSEYAVELDSRTASVNGEARDLVEVEGRLEHLESFVLTDVFEVVEEGTVRRLRRTFDELKEEEHSSFASADGDEGDQGDDGEYESMLEGRTVLFTWNEGSGGLDVAFADDDEGGEELLGELEEDMDLRRLLPSSARSVGDSWEIEGRAFACILDPGGDLGLERAGAEETERDAMRAELRANLAGTITATYREAREEDGVRQGVIALKIDARTEAGRSLEGEHLPRGASGTARTEMSYQLEGELLWDLEHGHAIALELSGECGLTMKRTITVEYGDDSLEQEQEMDFSGEASFSMRVERR